MHAIIFILKSQLRGGPDYFPFINNHWRVRKVKNMGSHPAGKPLSPELNPESEGVLVSTAPGLSNRETPGWPDPLGGGWGFQGDRITACTY